jgi:hypothetical protein
MGIVSFILSLAAPAVMVLLIVVIGATATQSLGNEGQPSAPSPLVMVASLGIVACLGVMVAGLGLGIAGCCQKKRKRVFAVIGTVFNGVIVVGMAVMTIPVMLARMNAH